MLVIFSDLHLTDCSTARNPHETAFQLLGDEISASAKAKSAKELEILMLGDIFDVVRTDYWHRSGIAPEDRPWGGRLATETAMNPDPNVEKQFEHVLDAVLGQTSSQALIGMLRSLETTTGLEPHVTYVIGNHDRVLNNFPGLQARIQGAFAPLNVSFANVYESPDYAVRARHGHEWDENCHGWQFYRKVLNRKSRIGRFDPKAYLTMAIGEIVTAELMSGLIYYAREALDPVTDKAFLDNLIDVNNLRPMTDVFPWLAWNQQKKYAKACQQAVVRALDGLLTSSFAKKWDKTKRNILVSGDITDYLQTVRDEVQRRGLESVGASVKLLESLGRMKEVVVGKKEPLLEGADEEAKGLPDDSPIQYIVYGHTHRARQDCFSAGLDGRVHLYINTGTFLPLIEGARDHSFFRSNRMTFVCFYRSDEDTAGRADDGPTMDVWDGMKRKNYL